MGREIKRVPMDFDAELCATWPGYLMPTELLADPCPDCEHGYSPYAEHLFNLWYGYVPFRPEDNGSTPLTVDTPAVRAFAERNVARAPWHYGTSEAAVAREAHRLVQRWNRQWSHHLSQADVDALLEADRLWDFTRTCRPGEGWKEIDPRPHPSAAQVNEWSLRGFVHDALNAGVVIRARCQRDGVEDACPRCEGRASVETYPGQRADAEAWQRTEPPKGRGWQLWQTVTEGGPVSPVFATPEELARWMVHEATGASRASSTEVALRFIHAGWAPSGSSGPSGFVSGVEAVGAWE